MKKSLKYLLPILGVAILWYFFPKVAGVLILCGIYDVSRNRKLDMSVLLQYFFGNGLLTWLLSPFNTLLDIFCLPFVNKGVYKLEDLPSEHQAEIQRLIDASREVDLVGQIEEHAKDQQRSMVFFKWYGENEKTIFDVPAFHEDYKYIKTIGVSVFNKKASTSRHFGPFRATIRVLYNVNDMDDDSAYIVVGDTTQYWREEKLFIFDDTLMHQSFNESDKARYCLFVDILRPTTFPAPLVAVVTGIRFFLKGVNSIFYKNWKMIGN